MIASDQSSTPAFIGVLYNGAMSVTVDLPDDILAELQAEAARRGVSVDTVVTESVTEHLRPGQVRRRFAFVGMGHSGDGELSTRYKDYRRAAVADKAVHGA